jgi:hypothetical protein
MAQSAARFYPKDFRLLGATIDGSRDEYYTINDGDELSFDSIRRIHGKICCHNRSSFYLTESKKSIDRLGGVRLEQSPNNLLILDAPTEIKDKRKTIGYKFKVSTASCTDSPLTSVLHLVRLRTNSDAEWDRNYVNIRVLSELVKPSKNRILA